MQIERDAPSGYLTTGHEWNGIKELNTPVPRIVWFFIAVTHIWALGYLAADAGLSARESPIPRACWVPTIEPPSRSR